MGIVGEHGAFGPENMSVSHDGTLLASCIMEEVVQFWNIEYLHDIDNEDSKKVCVAMYVCVCVYVCMYVCMVLIMMIALRYVYVCMYVCVCICNNNRIII